MPARRKQLTKEEKEILVTALQPNLITGEKGIVSIVRSGEGAIESVRAGRQIFDYQNPAYLRGVKSLHEHGYLRMVDDNKDVTNYVLTPFGFEEAHQLQQ